MLHIKWGDPITHWLKRCYLCPCYFSFWQNIPSFSASQLNEIKFHPQSLNGGRFQMKIHSTSLQFPYSQRSWLKAIFDELFTSLELFVQFSIWKPDPWNRVAIAQASVINAHSNLAEEVFGSVQLAHIILTFSNYSVWVFSESCVFCRLYCVWFRFHTEFLQLQVMEIES